MTERETFIGIVETVLNDYEKEFTENPSNDVQVQSFREGLKFGYKYLLVLLNDNHEWLDLKIKNLEKRLDKQL